MNKTVNIIGSGIGGLFSGAILAIHGFKVNIFEARVEIGGYCSSWKRGDYTFETSLHELNGFYPDDKKLRYFRLFRFPEKIKFLKIPSPYTSVFKDFEFKMPHNSNDLKMHLSNLFPEEANNINYIIDKMQKISEQATGFISEKNSFYAFLQVPQKYPLMLTTPFTTLYDFIWKKIKNPKVRTILAQLYLYYADSIDKLNTVYFAAPTFSYYNESYYISGSSRKLIETLRDIIIENGGNIYTHKKVTKIIFENQGFLKPKKAIGIEVNGKEKYFSDLTICNAPIIDTFENLIDKKDFSGYFRNKAINIKPSTSIFTMYIGLKKNHKELGIEDYCYIFNELDDLKDVALEGKWVDFEKRPLVMVSYILDDSLVSKDKTVINVCVPDNIKYWEKYTEKEEYKKEKERIRDILLKRIEKRFPGFIENIEVIETGTPITAKKFSNNNNGAVYGAAQETFQTNIFRFPNIFHKRNLYFASSWVVPGGGISGAMISAIITSEAILDRFGIENKANSYISPAPEPFIFNLK